MSKQTKPKRARPVWVVLDRDGDVVGEVVYPFRPDALWGTSRATRTIRALQKENRAMRAALIDCNIQSASNADQCDDCEWVMRRSGNAVPVRAFDSPPKKRKVSR